MLVLRQAGPLHPLDLPATCPHVREVASLRRSSRDPSRPKKGETLIPTRSVGRTSSATPGRELYPSAGSTAVGVTPGGVTIGIGAGTTSFP